MNATTFPVHAWNYNHPKHPIDNVSVGYLVELVHKYSCIHIITGASYGKRFDEVINYRSCIMMW